MELDYLVLAAHPDDAELYCGGLLVKMQENGYHTGVLDCSRGEAGTTGSVAEREQETAKANDILKLSYRDNLAFPDSGLTDDIEIRTQVVNVIRKYRVKLLIAPVSRCRHPDHSVIHQVARATYFFSGAGKFPSDYPPWRPRRIMYHLEFYETQPSFVIDISDQFDAKMRAVDTYATQFFNPNNTTEKTVVGSRRFRERMIARFKFYGNLIDCDYGEPYVIDEMIRMDDPLKNVF